MTPERVAQSVNGHLSEFFDCFTVVGIMPDGRQLIIRHGDEDQVRRDLIEHALQKALASFKTR